jgi:hypothetical protein
VHLPPCLIAAFATAVESEKRSKRTDKKEITFLSKMLIIFPSCVLSCSLSATLRRQTRQLLAWQSGQP